MYNVLYMLGVGSAEAANSTSGDVSSDISSSETTFQSYINSQQQYVLSIPSGWEKVDKAGVGRLCLKYRSSTIRCITFSDCDAKDRSQLITQQLCSSAM